MRVALISDIHGNEAALNAVLQDIERTGVDQLICLGDTATLGPCPSFVLDKLQSIGCLCIEGNHDAFMLEADLIHTYTEAPIVVDSVEWCRDRLSASELQFISTFQSQAIIPLDGTNALHVFHGSPRSHMEDLLVTMSPEALDEALAGASATLLAGGHTHLQMLRQHRGMLLVNPGSVGLPFKEAVTGRAPTLLKHAEYAIVEASKGSVNVNLRRVPVDAAALRKTALSSDNPINAMLLEAYA